MIIRKEQKHRAYEMPSSRKDLINDIFAQAKNIVENWALCMYCFISSPDEHETLHHWATELNNALTVIKKQTLAKGMSKKACLQMIQGDNGMSYPDFSSWDSVHRFISEKFKKDEIDFSTEYIADLFMKEVEDLIEYLSDNPGQPNAYDYIKQHFDHDLGVRR